MKRRERGFTLLEALVVMALVGLLVGLAVPGMTAFVRNARMTSVTNDLLASFYLARTEAIKRRTPAAVCSSAAPQDAEPSCSVGSGWVVWADTNGDAVIDDGEPILSQHDAVAAAIDWYPRSATGVLNTNWYVRYNDAGVLSAPSAAPAGRILLRRLVLCDSRGNVTSGGELSAARGISLSVIGRPGITREPTEIESLGGGSNDGCS